MGHSLQVICRRAGREVMRLSKQYKSNTETRYQRRGAQCHRDQGLVLAPVQLFHMDLTRPPSSGSRQYPPTQVAHGITTRLHVVHWKLAPYRGGKRP